MKRSPIRRAVPEIVRIGLLEFTLPAGLSKARRRIFIAAAEQHTLERGEITVADAQRILRKREAGTRIALATIAARTKRTRTKYARRERDTPYMMAVKALPCAVESFDMPWPIDHHTPCSAVVEADHMGDRGRGQKAKDDTCVPMCSRHHAERGDHTGRFQHATKALLREWRAMVIAATQATLSYLRGMP